MSLVHVFHSQHVVPLTQLIAEASYARRWLHRLSSSPHADAAICVFEPNVPTCPHESSLTYVGAFEYRHP
jgi:hypothetical protein